MISCFLNKILSICLIYVMFKLSDFESLYKSLIKWIGKAFFIYMIRNNRKWDGVRE